MTTLLTVSELSVQLQQKNILNKVELTLSAGDILGLVGPSGCGKTTLLNAIAGFVEQVSGSIVLGDNALISAEQITPPEQRHIGMIFQDYALFPHLTVSENVAFGIAELTKELQKERVGQLLSLLKLHDFADRYPHQLSGGQQQRVAIARALAPQPNLLLLDEPFSNIDARLRNELMLELRSLLKQLQMTAIFVTHNKDEVFTFADKIAVMHQGNILQSGAPAKVFQAPNSWQVADFLQIGSWLPVSRQDGLWHCALGPLTESNELAAQHGSGSESKYLLVKPKYLRISNDKQVNAKVSYVSLTEQGFHYLLSSLSCSKSLSFEQLSFYSETSYQQEQELAVEIIAHEYQIFSQ